MRGNSYRIKGNTKLLMCSVIGALFILAALLAVGCGRASSPQGVVKRFWEALGENDQNAMLDCIEPDLRVGVNPFGCVLPGGDWAIIISRGLKSTGLEFSDLRYEVLDNDGSTAHVRIPGRIKLPEDTPILGGTVRELRLTHTMIRRDNQWFLSCSG